MDRSWEALLLGRTLAERYVLEAVIGRGGMSVVYRARDLRLERPVALKVISPSAPGGAARVRLRERFRREAGAAAGVPPHANLVHVYDYGTDAELDLDFIVMELLRGRDLKAALAHDPPDAQQAMRIVLEAARGLAAGHRAGLVHRDVKPANLFLVGEAKLESVRVLDFGIAKVLETDDDLTLLGGAPPHTPAYASPELLDLGRPLTPASDVYQLGLVAYELVAGARPFTDAERERIRAGEAVPLPARGAWARAPAAVQRVIARALAADPAERYADAAAFAEALAGAASRTPGEAAEPAGSGPAAADTPAAAPAPVHDESTLLDPALERLQPAAPTRAAAVPAGWHPGNTVRAVVLVVLGVGVLGAVAHFTGDRRQEPAEDAAQLDFVALDAEFRELQLAAASALADAIPAAEGPEAAEQIQTLIADLHQAWADADAERFGAHYAPRVDFHGRSRVRRASVVRERMRDRERFDQVSLMIDRQAIEFPAQGRARALVDRSWRLRGPGIQWDGASRQQLILELQEGRWRIAAEDELETYRSDCTGC